MREKHASTQCRISYIITQIRAGPTREGLNSQGHFIVKVPPKKSGDSEWSVLKKVLLYHVVPGNVMAKDVVKLKSAKTAQGSSVAISVKGKTVKINNATVILPPK